MGNRRKQQIPQSQLLDLLTVHIPSGDIERIEDLLAKGVPVNGDHMNGSTGSSAIRAGHTHILALLLRHGADPRFDHDVLFRDAVYYNRVDAIELLAAAVFSPDLWRGKTLPDIQKEAEIIDHNIQLEIELYGLIDSTDELKESAKSARLEIFDAAMKCWEHVRPDPPEISISKTPAKPRPL